MEVTRRHLLTLAAATGAAAAFTPTAATAAVPGRGGVLRASAPSLHPEGVAWDATRGAFLVSSLRHGTVSVVR
ncbi:MAG TPA: hypothetical protein VFT95_19900, partial [Micromonosporaceae bacterium]|nr:hypothetical protein [Micromonosporaceae bacterium]